MLMPFQEEDSEGNFLEANGKKHARVEKDRGRDLPDVSGDEGRWQQDIIARS